MFLKSKIKMCFSLMFNKFPYSWSIHIALPFARIRPHADCIRSSALQACITFKPEIPTVERLP